MSKYKNIDLLNYMLNWVMLLFTSELAMPSLIVMNMTIDGYYLPEQNIETIEELLQFLNNVLNGKAKVCFNCFYSFIRF